MRDYDSTCVAAGRSALQTMQSPEPHAEALRDGNAEHAVITTNLSGEITDWNGGAERLFGRTRSEAVGLPAHILVPPENRTELSGIFQAVRSNQSVSRHAIVGLRNCGARIDVSLTASSLRGPDGAPVAALLVAHDLAPIKRLEQQYLQAQRMETFGRLAGGVAHDFNNLLTVILGYSEILMGRSQASESSHELLNEIHKASARASSLTRQLLTFSRKQVTDMKALDLNAVISDTEKMLRRLIGEDILMTTIFAPKLWPVRIDPGQLQQVILNLAVNARDAMPHGGRLTIETDNVRLDEAYASGHPDVQPGEFVLLAMTDEGIGMDAQTQARIFEPLFTTKTAGQGTGLGLTTVQHIVHACGGHILVYSEPGHGTTFKVYLPRAQAQTPAPAADDSALMPRGGETLLLVEDEDCVRLLARQVLEMCGYTVYEATHGDEALCVFHSHTEQIQLLVTDVVLPHVHGPLLAENMLAVNPRLKVLFVSGYPDHAVVRHGLLNGNVAFLHKPYTTSALAQKVREVLDQPADKH